jgi:hypothetical protein
MSDQHWLDFLSAFGEEFYDSLSSTAGIEASWAGGTTVIGSTPIPPHVEAAAPLIGNAMS